jgi:pimeloyl-ACP methyl ester carboxylesterase
MVKSILLSVFLSIPSYGILNAQIPDSGYIKVGKDSIFYESSGSGKVIILIHDGLLDREVWNNQFFHYSKYFRVIRYDRRGYGNSSPSSEHYSNPEDLNTLFTYLKIDSACLIGCSSGGGLAIDFTLQYPQKVTSLVLVGAVVGGLPYTSHMTTRGGYLPPDIKDFKEVSIYYTSKDPYEIYYENTAVKETATELVKKYPLRDNAPHTYDPQAYRRLNEIKVPALIIVGEFDIPDVHAHSGAINAGILNSKRIIIPRSGHLVPMEQPDLFNEAVDNFLKIK